MKKNVFSNAAVAAVFAIIIGFTYAALSKTFFQQDEWASIGQVFAKGVLGILPSMTVLDLLAGKQRILGSLINNAFHYYFPFQILPFVVFSLFLHWVNTLVVYRISEKILRNATAAFVAAAFFTVATSASQAVTWISAHTTVLPNALFLLICVFYFLRYKESDNIVFLHRSFFALFVSYLFKESSFFMILYLPLMDYALSKKRIPVHAYLRRYVPVLLFLCFIVGDRWLGLQGAAGKGGAFVSNGDAPALRVMLHLLFYPLVGFSQVFVPGEILFPLAGKIQAYMYGFISGIPFQQAITRILVSDFLSLFLTLLAGVVIAACWYAYPKNRQTLLFSALFILMSFFPYAVLDRPASSYLESRYYYIGAIGGGLLLGCAFLVLKTMLLTMKKRTVSGVLLCALFAVYGLYLYKQIQFTRRGVARSVIESQERLKFLHTLTESKSSLPHNPIFYVTGDSPGYYAVPGLAVPFQEGLGYTLAVWFFDTGTIPASLLSESYLWNINEQGYAERDGKGFGYFMDLQRLQEEYAVHPELRVDQILAFRYIARDQKLVNISNEVRQAVAAKTRHDK